MNWLTRLFKRDKSKIKVKSVRMSPLGPLMKLAPTNCPCCKHNIDIGIGRMMGTNNPGTCQDGDVGVCHFCSAVLEFTDGKLHPISDAGWNKLPDGLKKAVLKLSRESGPRLSGGKTTRDEVREVFGDE